MLHRYIQNPCEEYSQQQSNRARQAYINRKNTSNSTASTCEAETDRSAKNLRRHGYAGATVIIDEEEQASLQRTSHRLLPDLPALCRSLNTTQSAALSTRNGAMTV